MTTKKSLEKILILLLMAGMMNSYIFSRVFSNGAGTGYGDDGNPDGIQEVDERTIEMYIVEGSGYYLRAVASINNILKLYECQDLNGIDFYYLNKLLNKALIDIDNAITAYETLIMKAESTPYNKEILAKLAVFDYYTFMTEKRLNKEIFQQVEGYLKAGYIIGVFKKTYDHLLSIRLLIVSIKNMASVNNLPNVDTMWQLNEQCLETSYFGSYVARVFESLK